MVFQKRRFKGLGHVARDAAAILSRPGAFLFMATGHNLSPAFREKLMLAVTSVNRCRYCSFVHTQAALREGFSPEEIESLLAGAIEDVEDDEREALLYAMHWADRGGDPDPACREKLVSIYGEPRTGAIETALRTIMFGNYFGNTVDWALHGISGGTLARDDGAPAPNPVPTCSGEK